MNEDHYAELALMFYYGYSPEHHYVSPDGAILTLEGDMRVNSSDNNSNNVLKVAKTIDPQLLKAYNQVSYILRDAQEF